jgi:hypothetical protein
MAFIVRLIPPFVFEIDSAALAGSALWALGLYLGFSPVADWITEQLNRWLNYADRWLYPSAEEFERTRQARESQNAFLASLLSILPFFVIGVGCNLLVDISLGRSWSISLGILACVGCGVYELGRRTGQNYE